jgi:NAD(P)-dependent dehydrogenase (short-subunit alcohol dehydrogenase family)
VKEGAHVFIFGRRRDALDEAVQLIGANVTAIQADASRLEDLDRVDDAVRSAKGKVDVVVSNAALVEQVPLPEITPDHYDRTFTLNAKAPLFLVQKMLPMMGSGGSIILVASAMHYMGLANHSTYAATKAALRSYSRTWAAKFKDSGIRANTLSPGVVGPLPRLGRELVHDGLRHGRRRRRQQRLTKVIRAHGVGRPRPTPPRRSRRRSVPRWSRSRTEFPATIDMEINMEYAIIGTGLVGATLAPSSPRRPFPSSSPIRAAPKPSAIFYLASDESSFTTGIDLVADGGLSEF